MQIVEFELQTGDKKGAQLASANTNPALLKSFQLEQNYPNPFNPGTTITYTLPEESQVSLWVYDITGRIVATVVQEQQQPGTHQLIWNANNHPSGNYFYQLRAGSFNETRRMTLLK